MADGFFDNCKIREHQSCLHLKWTSIPVFNQLSAVKILYNTFYSFLALKPQEIFEKSIKSPPTPILSNIPHQPSMFNGSTSMIPTHFHFLNNASDEKRYSIWYIYNDWLLTLDHRKRILQERFEVLELWP